MKTALLCLFFAFFLLHGCQCTPPIPSESLQDGAETRGEKETLLEETQKDANEDVQEIILLPDGIHPEESMEQERGEISIEEKSEEIIKNATLSFRVLSSAEDIVPPRLKSLSISPNSLKAGEYLQIFVETQDDLSGVVGVQLTLSSPTQKHTLFLSTIYHPSRRQFVGRIQIPRYAEAGAWEITRATLQDRAGNPSVYLKHQSPLDQAKWIVLNDSPDTEAAALLALNLQGTQAKAGDELGIVLVMAPDPSGLKRIQVTASSDQGGYTETNAFFHPQRKQYEAYLPIPRQGPNGAWSISQVRIEDRAENTRIVQSQDPVLLQKNFTVSGSAPPPPPPKDLFPPRILALHLSHTERKTKEFIYFLLKAQDLESGIARSRITISDPSGADRLFVDMAYNVAKALWEGSIEIPAYARDGLWKIRSISATDHAGNTQTLEGQALSDLPALSSSEQGIKLAAFATVGLSSAVWDRSAPSILGMRIAPGEISVAEDSRLYVAIRDPSGRGIASASCTAQGPQPTLQKRVLLQYNADTGFYEGNFGFQSADALGEWWVSGCYLTNKNGQSASLAGDSFSSLPPLDISRATSRAGQDPFVVIRKGTPPSPSTDQQAPQLKSYQISRAQIQIGEDLRMYALLEDAAGSHPLSVRCSFRSERSARDHANDRTEVILTYRAATRRWEGEFSISSLAVEGAWWLQECITMDAVQNTALYERDALVDIQKLIVPSLANPPSEHRGFFLVAPSSKPSPPPPPTIEAAAIAPQQQHGLIGRVFLRVKEQDALDFAFCAIKPPIEEPPQTPYLSAQLVWNPLHRLWEGNFHIPPHSVAGLWSLSRCQVTDRHGGTSQISDISWDANKQIDLTGLFPTALKKQISLEVTQGSVPPIQDTTPPVLQSLRWLPSDQIEAGQIATLQVAAEDTDSGIASISVQIQSPNQKAIFWLSFQKNTAEQRWEAEQQIPLYKEDGAWSITQLTIVDRAGNQRQFSATDPAIQSPLHVSKTRLLPEQDAPHLLTLSRTQATLLGGESTRFLAELRDASALQQVFLQLQAPSGKQQHIPLLWNPATARHEGDITFPDYAETGVWKISTFVASDIYENTLRLAANDSRISGWSITVRRAPHLVDQEPPIVGLVMLSAALAPQGTMLRLLAQIKDSASGVASANAMLQHTPSGQQIWAVLEYNPASTLYEGNVTIPTHAERGMWKIVRLDVSDNAQNTKRYTDQDPELRP